MIICPIHLLKSFNIPLISHSYSILQKETAPAVTRTRIGLRRHSRITEFRPPASRMVLGNGRRFLGDTKELVIDIYLVHGDGSSYL
jgi:hypothetical protein